MSDEQSPDVLQLGRHVYPPLKIREEADPQHPESGRGDIDFEYFVYLTAFEERFNARWSPGARSYGRLNPMYYYGGTEREASLAFSLPALTVQESRQNLHQCSELARAVYGRYREWTLDSGSAAVKDFTMVGHRYFRIDFGSLIRDERAFISGFTFNINPDAGVFDFAVPTVDESFRAELHSSLAPPVNSMEPGQVFPRQIDVQLNIIFRHHYPLGFGGPNRVGLPTRWAENRNRDFPHGTGHIDVQPYMSRTAGTTTTAKTLAERIEIYNYHGDSPWMEEQILAGIAAEEARLVEELEAEVAALEAAQTEASLAAIAAAEAAERIVSEGNE
jgi:hypothetical protein